MSIVRPSLASFDDLIAITRLVTTVAGQSPQELTLDRDDKVDRILEFHLVYPHGRVVPLPIVLADILAEARAQLFDNAQWRIIGYHQVRRLPPDHHSASWFRIQRGR